MNLCDTSKRWESKVREWQPGDRKSQGRELNSKMKQEYLLSIMKKRGYVELIKDEKAKLRK